MSNKTPFELRADMLHVAHSILASRAEAESNRLMMERFDKSTEAGEPHNPHFGPVVSPTTEEIIQEATKLNEFISRSSDRK